MRRHTALATALVVSLLACRDPNAASDSASPLTSEALSGLSAGGPSTDASGIAGSVGSLAGVCPTVTFTLEGKAITASAATRYEGGSCLDLKNGARVKVSGATQTNGSVAAQAIGFAAPAPAPTPSPKEPTTSTAAVKGTVKEVAGTCPLVSLKLEGKTITTTATTRYEGGVCADVKAGVVISVIGTVQADQSIVAQSIGIASPVPVPPKDPVTSTTTAVKGTASEVAGACPVISLKLEGKKINTSATTRYEGGACADVKNGVLISVVGTVQADQSIVAQSIAVASPVPAPPKDPATPTAPTVKGAASDVAGTCPLISLKLEGKKITTTATTRYEGGACADVKNGALIAVAGNAQADGSMQAVVIWVSK